MKNLWKNKIFWEVLGYLTIALLIFGQITVGYIYLIAQCVYLVANIISTIRCYALDQPKADKIRNFVFSGITLGLIVIYCIK